ncbi:hypothetical protein CCMA1212_005189 [Trichoderma ghanense]|uniref:Uncharacterized protein n=1 Tax=Trichoderma ghanense TaxID=65468 RepID=A0ABY2H582_9HYPO
MAESKNNRPSNEADSTDQRSSMMADIQRESFAQPSTARDQTISRPSVKQPDQELQDEEYLEGSFNIDERRKRFDENSCTVEDKEISDLFKKGLLDDGSTGPLKGDFTLNHLPQLSGDEACSIQWTTSNKKKQKQKTSTTTGNGTGLSDDELASVLQACPDLEGFIANH